MKRSVTPSQKEREQNLSLKTGLGLAAVSVRSDVLGTTRNFESCDAYAGIEKA